MKAEPKWLKLSLSGSESHKHSSRQMLKLTVLASVKGLYSSKPPGGADRVTWVTEGSYRGKNIQTGVTATVQSQNKTFFVLK